ncbi:hypothetical protein FIM04_01265 [SAR202 cluster bacterium AC-409-J13_OGT_754m]|nr:hypothetical protein [SAR202 cluster bacterium AC-409-J13_OGT_754m]
MKRLFVIAMLMFTVLACSTGPTEQEVDNLKKAHIAQLEKNTAIQKQIDVLKNRTEELETELNNSKLVDFIVVKEMKTNPDSASGKDVVAITYQVGDSTETIRMWWNSECHTDTVIGAPLPLSCR